MPTGSCSLFKKNSEMSFQSMKMQQAGMLTDEKGDAVSGKLSLEEEVNTELDRLGQGGRWVW